MVSNLFLSPTDNKSYSVYREHLIGRILFVGGDFLQGYMKGC